MEKRAFLLISVLLLASLGCFAQEDYRARLDLKYQLCNLAVSPDGELMLAMDDFVCVAASPQSGWEELPRYEPYRSVNDCCWMSPNTIVAGGYGGLKIWKRNQTGSFTLIASGISDAVDGVFSRGDGKAWAYMSNKILYSDNEGQSWHEITSLPELVTREDELMEHEITDVYFDGDGKHGLLGTDDNLLYVTRDNCQTVQRIPTPLDQHLYQIEEREDYVSYGKASLGKVRIYNDYYIIEQHHQVYITRADNIIWAPLDSAADFEVTSSGYLVKIGDGHIRFVNKNFKVVKEYDCPENVKGLVAGDKLYVITSTVLHEFDIDGTRSYALFYKNKEIAPDTGDRVADIYTVNGQEFCFQNTDLIAKSGTTGRWYRYMPLGMDVYDSFEDNGVLYFYSWENFHSRLYQVNLPEKSYEPYQWPTEMFARKKVRELRFISKESGCFHYSNHIRFYRLQGNEFLWERDSVEGGRKRINNQQEPVRYPELPKRFNAQDIQQLVELIDYSRTKQFIYPDTVITADDMTDYQRLIKELIEEDVFGLEVKENEYDKYVSMGQTIRTIDEDELYRAFDPSMITSTSVDEYKLEFVFEDGTVMSCRNNDYVPNFMYSPWTVKWGDYECQTRCMRIGWLINNMTEGKMLNQRYCSKAFAIYLLTKYYIESAQRVHN